MPNPTPQDLHVDGVRTELSLMFANDREMLVADAIAPIVPVNKQSDLYAVWDRADTMRIQIQQRAAGAPSDILSQGVSTSQYFTKDYSGKTLITDKMRAQAVGEFELDQAMVKFLNEQILLKREAVVAAAFFTTSVWGTDVTPGTKWSAGSSDPYGDLETGMDEIQLQTGTNATDLVLGQDVWKTLKHHADTLDRIKGGSTNSDPARVTLEQIAAVVGVKRVHVAAAVYNSAGADATVSMARLYDTNDALLISRPDTPSQLTPSAAYTFSWSQFDGVTGEGASIRSWNSDDPLGEWMEVEANFAPTVTSSAAGYFFNEATS